MFKYKPQLLFHHTARFPWHPLFVNSSSPSLQCQECPRSILSGMCPVRTTISAATPPPSSQDLKDLAHNTPGDAVLLYAVAKCYCQLPFAVADQSFIRIYLRQKV